VLLHRSPALRRPQFFASADWPGYTMLNSTMQSTKSGGPLAGAWAVVNTIGDDGYLELTRIVFDGVDRLVAGVGSIPELSVVGHPDSTLVAVAADDSCDVFSIADAMTRAGWHVQPQLSFRGQRPTIHLSLSAATAPLVDEFLDALRKAVTEAVAAGPITVDPEVVAFVRALDPDALSDTDFDGLLAAVGMAGGPEHDPGVGLPESMAEINALLDLARPALREALLVAFLDRLTRPLREDR
jgi:sphinganine-1-phosphate aldolase